MKTLNIKKILSALLVVLALAAVLAVPAFAEEPAPSAAAAVTQAGEAAEAEAEGGGSDDLEERVAAMETGKADKDEVQAVWDQMAAAYSEGVQEA